MLCRQVRAESDSDVTGLSTSLLWGESSLFFSSQFFYLFLTVAAEKGLYSKILSTAKTCQLILKVSYSE